ncbi:hypothetical protein YQE_01995, partial [Dendroctonus ponderosae]
MFNDERLPLFSKNGYTSDESISGNTSNDVVVPVYGTTCEPAVSNAKLVPVEERITYTWSGINVFTNVGMVSNESNFFPCWNTNLDQGVQGKHLLKNVSGMAYPGELLAILGSSGAGKTTLLNALTFRSAKNITVTGTRCVNGTTVNSKALTSLSAYVQQDELFIGSLTVKEHLRFQALVRMDANISYEERMQRVNEVILEMTLNKCENTCIGISGRLKGISGGELKRLSFAAEVLTNPSLMFCDEPTSGLDSFMALNVVQTLKSMAQSGKTVICTIHQPSSELYTMFDKLLLMAEGRIAFLGTPEDADLFFRELEAPCPKNYNPADYFIQLLAIVPGNEESCRNAVNMICDRFQRSEAGVQVALESATASGEFLRHNGTEVWLNGNNGNKSPYKASWCAQFRAVVWRSWLSIIKEPLLVRVRLFQTILVSLVLGAIYYGQVINQDGVMNINGAIFLFLTNMTFQNVFAVINVFSAELPIFLREHKNGMYRTDVYFLGKTIADIPIFIFLPILFTAICYYMIGLNSEMPRFFVACGIVILVANAATSFGKCKEPLVQVVGGQILKKFAQSQHEIKRVSMEAATPDRVGQPSNGGSSTNNYENPSDFEPLDASQSLTKKTRSYSKWSPMEEGVTLAWSDLTVHARTKIKGKLIYKRIINSVTGALKSGSLAAIMGASGAGKSTLMAALGYRQTGEMQVDGDIVINGRPIGSYMKHLSGYMPQEDLFVGSLTVLEHMNIMAHLKLDRLISSQEKSLKIKTILNQLGLRRCANTCIGARGHKGLSGGEKKRLAFATELLNDPPILFCDEPTTGLDSYSAQKIVSIMSRMSTNGKTILCTIHQPSSAIFGMFTQLILVADGRIAYMGRRATAIEFFEDLGYVCPSSYSPADFFIKTLSTTVGHENNSRMTVKKICDHYTVSDYAKEVDVVVQYEFHMGRAEGIALIVGLSFYSTNFFTQKGIQAVQGAIFMFVCENTFNPMYSVLAEFPENIPLFVREFRSGLYHPATYYVSRILALLPGFLIEPLLFASIAYWIAGLRSTSYAFLMTTLITVLTTNVSCACGIMFSCAFESVPIAMAYLVPFDYLLMVTSGLFVKRGTIPVIIGWSRYLSWMMYSTESISIIQWQSIRNISCDIQDDDSLPCLSDGTSVLDQYAFSEDNLACDIWNMFFLLIGFHLLGYVFLWWKTKRA